MSRSVTLAFMMALPLCAGALPPRAARMGTVRVEALASLVPARLPSSRAPRAAARMAARADSRDVELIKGFVFQRALQTVIFYMRTCRDSATADWLERYLDLDGIDEYHGLDGLRKPWRDIVTDLLAEPPTTIVLHSIPRNRSGSGNNPFLPPKILTMDFDINPQRIALRLLECSAEVSRECVSDLGKMAQENEAIRRSHQVQGSEQVRAATLPIIEQDTDSGDSKSAFRGGTYDLLKRLATREAVRATLVQYERERLAGAQAYLARFREAKGARLDGESGYNAADDFLRELLAQMPSIGSAGPVDPVRIANTLLDEREVAAARWIEVLASMPADLQDLKRDFLEKGLR